ncbi:MAG: Protein-L-isoaspartate O-methyltransferase [Candidatus Dichloromethanomonas elyunquensis]|nr:MAG: Protein-L-isoaspartate O-methyltransferase [Candidatus Dichloromethanomonas elyunquensis]
MDQWEDMAQILVEKYVAPQGIHDVRVLEAMKKIPRHLFIPEAYREYSYMDSPLPVGEEQTISQPFMAAKMTELLALKEGNKVLEVGTGSGYQAALLAEMGVKVTTIERIQHLAEKARKVFRRLSYPIESIIGDGREGYVPNAPYDRIIVTAGAPRMEDSWLIQLAEGGRIVVPLSTQEGVYCLLVRKKTRETVPVFEDTWYDYCRFVPLLSGVKKKDESFVKAERT